MIRAAFVAAVIALATPATAQQVACMPRATLVKTLEDKHGERLTGGGLRSATQVVEIWSSDETGSFTVFVTRADGLACVIATGQNWFNAGPGREPPV